jgi:hypothetical protein
MRLLIGVFEQMRGSNNFIPYTYVAERWQGSRAMLDILLEQAFTEGLIKKYPGNSLDITLAGKLYAVENKIS